jgi:RND family efflux transporter MFP subunit
MRKHITIAVTFVVIIAALLGASTMRRPKPPAATTKEIWKKSGVPVKTSTVTRGDIDQTVQITGDVRALNCAVVSPKISGRLTTIYVNEGDRVSHGQVVATLDQGDAQSNLEAAQASLESARARLAQAITNAEVTKIQTKTAVDQAQASLRSARARLEVTKNPSRSQERLVAENRVASAKANLDNAEADFKRNQRLLNRGAISESAFDVVNTKYLVAQADHKTAQEQLSMIDEGGRREDISSSQAQVDVAQGQLRDAAANTSQNRVKEKDILAAKAAVQQAQAAVDTARRQLADTYIKASISGVVSSRSADPGQVVSPGQTLANIVDLSSVYFRGDVSETYMASVARGQSLDVRLDAAPDKVFKGRVAEIFPSASTANRNFSVRISISGGDSVVKPGMSASGEILTGKAANVILVPKDAIDESNGVKSVYTVQADKTVKKYVVSVVREDDGFAQIATPTDLSVGSAVVTQGHGNVQDGDLVEIRNGGSGDVAD